MKIIFQIDGGIGKNIAATAVCKAIKKQYPDDQLIVITGYPEIFLCNPNVDKALNFGNLQYFYKDHIEGQQVKMCLHNPYLETDFIMLNGHLIKVWCEMFGIQYNGELPELQLNTREQNFYANMFSGQGLFKAQKPIMVVQTNGGGKEQPNKYSWTRDLPIQTAQRVVDHFANDYTIVHIKRDDQLQLQNVVPIHSDWRSLFRRCWRDANNGGKYKWYNEYFGYG